MRQGFTRDYFGGRAVTEEQRERERERTRERSSERPNAR